MSDPIRQSRRVYTSLWMNEPARGLLNQPIRDGISDDQLVTRIILDWAISKLKGRRTCSEDLVVAEMLQALPDYCRNLLVELFNHRIRNENGNEVSSDSIWDQNIVTLLEKEANPTLPKQFRGITILAALQKLFLKNTSQHIFVHQLQLKLFHLHNQRLRHKDIIL